jgi:2-desacetyl-2-hydroxyethyl bacteriochlorophyllide A dehydrogenase
MTSCPSSALALWFVGPNQVELRREPLREASDTDVVARGLFSAISHGTESLLYSGDAPSSFDTSLGDPTTDVYPRRYGYAWVGEVVSGCLPRGTRIFSLATHADWHVLAADSVRVLPAALSPARATLAATLETAVNAVWDAELCFGESVLVIGAGSVGLLLALVAQQAGAARVVLADTQESRQARALRAGVAEVVAQPAPADVFDVVFEVTGNPAVLDSAVAHCAFEGRVVVVSFYGTRRSAVALGERFHRQRLRLISSQVSNLPSRLSARFDFTRRFELVLHWLSRLPLDELVSQRTDFSDVPAAYARLGLGQAAQVLITYQEKC